MLTNRIDRLSVKNYRSLGDVEVDLSDLTVLLGVNGSGKSNFLDALRFVSEALKRGLDAALIDHDRGGIGRVRRYSSKGRPHDITVTLTLNLNGQQGLYEFVLGSERKNEYSIKREKCELGDTHYLVQNGKLVNSTLPIGVGVVSQSRTLLLPLVGNLPQLIGLYNFLTGMGFYSIFPNNLRTPQQPGNPYPLDEHGENLITVLRELTRNKTEDQNTAALYSSLAAVVPGIDKETPISVTQLGSYLVARLKHEQDSGIFDLALESDGTLRVLGILTALYQTPALSLIGIEEPEMMLHPQAMGVLCDAIKEASLRSQIILTTHSPDLISLFKADELRIVERVEGVTTIGPITDANRATINDQLFSGGDLLRIGALQRG